MDTDKTVTKPVIITDGKSNARLFGSLVGFGAFVFFIFVIGSFLASSLGSISKPELHNSNNDQQLMSSCDALIHSGDLKTARSKLEAVEQATGLTPEMSTKLDEIYSLQAKQAAAKGNTKEAIEILKLIPTESSFYENAQTSIKSLSAVPKATKKVHVKPHPVAKSKHHR